MDFNDLRKRNGNHSTTSSSSWGSSDTSGSSIKLEYFSASPPPISPPLVIEYKRRPRQSRPVVTTTAFPTSLSTTNTKSIASGIAVPEVINPASIAAFTAHSSRNYNSSVAETATTSTAAYETKSHLSTRTVSSSSLSSNSSRSSNKRKRKSDNSIAAKQEAELDLEPSAKRQQRLPSLMSSAGYPSPLDELVDNIDTRSISDCASVASEFEVNSIANSEIILESPDDDLLPDDESDQEADYSYEYAVVEEEEEEVHDVVEQQLHVVHEVTKVAADVVATNAKQQMVAKKVQPFDDYLPYSYVMTPAAEPEPLRQCPLPALSWANAYDVWQRMCKKDQDAATLRSGDMMFQHPSLQPRMRAILLDWLIEVCEVYKLHRETYYLAVDYIDRYLFAKQKLPKTMLQLIGITCLFIAAKVEEIYPPKIGEFAYVTDGACQETDILQQEVIILQVLNWNISPVTPMGWLGIYMQLNVNNRTPRSLYVDPEYRKDRATATEYDEAFIYPQFSGMKFVQTAQLLDLCSLDVGIANYAYSVLAAAAISHVFNCETAMRCSGLEWSAIADCASWLEPFYKVTQKESANLYLHEQNEQVPCSYGLAHVCPNIITDESHIIQMHTTSLDMFNNACELRLLAEQSKCVEDSPATALMRTEVLLTPPASSRKPQGSLNEEDEVASSSKKTATKAKAKPKQMSAANGGGSITPKVDKIYT